MPRYLRFFEKKRGHRRTVSSKVGGAVQGAVFAVCFLGGGVSLGYVLFNYTLPEWRINREYVEATCTILSKETTHDPATGSDVPRFDVELVLPDQAVLTAWRPRGVTPGTASDAQSWLDRFELGGTYPCWYDPLRPSRVVLARGYTWGAWLPLLVPVPLLGIGGVGLAYVVLTWGKSTERRALIAQRASDLAPLETLRERQRRLPCMPSDEAITNSPGTTLAFRLGIASAGWVLLVLLAAALAWNGIVAVFLTMAVESHLHGDPDWPLTLFLMPFAVVGLVLAVFLVRRLVSMAVGGPTIVEISHHPLFPGREYQGFISQSGKLRLAALSVELVCEEEVICRQGTNAHLESRQVYRCPVLHHRDIAVSPSAPWEARFALAIPPSAMHSFRTEHNSVKWKLAVRGVGARGTLFDRAYVVHVHPEGPAAA